MGKLSKNARLHVVTSRGGPVRTTGEKAPTYQGGAGFLRDAKSELFLLGVSNMVSEETYYESGKDRDNRFAELIQEVTINEPSWVARFLPWLRTEANMRTAAIVGAAEYARTFEEMAPEVREAFYSAEPRTAVRQVVRSVLQRPDEPGEFIAYWTQGKANRTLPGGVQRGLADAVKAMYNERNSLKYDGIGLTWRMGDVIRLVHPQPDTPRQAALFAYLMDKRINGPKVEVVRELGMIRANKELQAMPVEARRAFLKRPEAPQRLREAGMTWESLATWLSAPLGPEGWTAIAPSLGIFALVRNLRNISEARVSLEVQEMLAGKVSDPELVKNSRMFPLRFYTAYREVPSVLWHYPLEKAINLSLGNVPKLKGRTLVLIDQSGSMHAPLSAKSTVLRSEASALFGFALGMAAENADVYVYGGDYYNPKHNRVSLPKGGSLLPLVQKHGRANMGGTYTWSTLRQTYSGHDRIVIVTDEQTSDNPTNLPDVPIVTFNVAGYRQAHKESGPKKITVGGLNDGGFTLIQAMDARGNGDWPF